MLVYRYVYIYIYVYIYTSSDHIVAAGGYMNMYVCVCMYIYMCIYIRYIHMCIYIYIDSVQEASDHGGRLSLGEAGIADPEGRLF